MTTNVNIEILHVPDCPNLALLGQRLHEAIADHPVVITYRLVADVDTAVVAGMAGSPTLLLNGDDPFKREGLEPSLSCRLYPHEDGHVEGAPSVGALCHAIDLRSTTATTETINAAPTSIAGTPPPAQPSSIWCAPS
jgi:hypothetical protein